MSLSEVGMEELTPLKVLIEEIGKEVSLLLELALDVSLPVG